MNVEAPEVAALVALAGVLLTLAINGQRAERERRRQLHGRALAAVMAYGEMPFMIRRRMPEEEHRSGERVRLTSHFSQVQAELATCQVLLRADGDVGLAEAFDHVVMTARETVGAAARDAWEDDPIMDDAAVNMPELNARLAPFRAELIAFEARLARATLPLRARVWRWMRGADLSSAAPGSLRRS